jgi:hypothetical protein
MLAVTEARCDEVCLGIPTAALILLTSVGSAADSGATRRQPPHRRDIAVQNRERKSLQIGAISVPFFLRTIFSDLASPADAGVAKAGKPSAPMYF